MNEFMYIQNKGWIVPRCILSSGLVVESWRGTNMKSSIVHPADDLSVKKFTGHSSQAVSCREARVPRRRWAAVIAAAAAWACLVPLQAEAAYSGSGTFNLITSTADMPTAMFRVKLVVE